MNRIPSDIRAGELHVWTADLDAAGQTGGGPHSRDSLSAEERERAARFVNRLDGERWARSRMLLRSLLGGYLSIDPAKLCFELGDYGKPYLASNAERAGDGRLDGAKLHFNLSHSGGLGLYVFALNCEVGCDIETPGRDIDVLAVAKRALGEQAAERLRLLEGDQREREFLRAWVRHEARLKCLGVGLTGAEDVASIARPWSNDLELNGAVGAVAAAVRPANVGHLRWRDPQTHGARPRGWT